MKYKLFCSDFDGTLLRDDFTVSEKDAASVRDYVRRGGTFVILTGRMTKNMDKWAHYLGTDGQPLYVCGFNGGLAVDRDGNEIFSSRIDYRVAARIIKAAEDRGLHVHTYERDNVLVSRSNFITKEYTRVCNITEREVGTLSKYVTDNKYDCLKILIVVAAQDMEKTLAEFKAMNFEGVQYVTSSENFLEIIPASGGKGEALKKIADFYGIPLSQTIAVGDQRNDIAMIRTAGLGCSVANAFAETKAAASYIAASNNDNAISEIIEKFTED